MEPPGLAFGKPEDRQALQLPLQRAFMGRTIIWPG
jgi:hypothetical protein